MLRKNKQTATGRSTGISLLSFLYGLLLLAIISGAGWITYLDYKNPGAGLQIEAQTEIAAVTLGKNPEKPKEEVAEVESEINPIAPADSVSEEKKPADIAIDLKKDNSENAAPVENQTSDTANADIAAPRENQQTTELPQTQPTTIQEDAPKSETKTEPLAKGEAKTIAKDTLVSPTTAETPPEPATSEPTEEQPVAVEQAPEKEVALAPVPDPELAKKSDFGLLPIISPSGKMPWRTYARPFEDPLARPRIAIIMSEMGMSSSATKTAIQKLPGAVTLSFNPYARDLQNWIGQARAAGHEVLLQLPMEPFGYPNNDPGPHSLLTSLTDRENLNRLEWMLGRFTGYSGVTNQMGSRFTSSLQDMEPIMTVLKERGLLFLDGRTSAKSIGAKVASQLGMPVAVNNRFLDHKADRATIDKRLSELEKIARFTGSAVGVGYPYPVTMERIAVWAQSLNRKGIVLAPISAIVNKQEIQ